MLTTLALVWGSSFLFIANGLESFDPVTIAFLRIALGVATLVLVPAARRTPIARADWPRILVLGVVWMAIPLTLFPLAEQWVSSAVAGMLNGAMPIMVTAIASLMLRRVPNRATFVGLAIGFAGVVLIALPSFGEGGSETKGIVLILVALVFYALSANLHVPVTLRYGSLPVQAPRPGRGPRSDRSGRAVAGPRRRVARRPGAVRGGPRRARHGRGVRHRRPVVRRVGPTAGRS